MLNNDKHVFFRTLGKLGVHPYELMVVISEVAHLSPKEAA